MKYKLLVMSVIFLITCVFVYKQQNVVTLNKTPLKQYLSTINNYKLHRHNVLTDNILGMLDLDDYFYADYLGPDGFVNLYIGYYYSANKAYAAHSPLVCYPSQGWKIEQEQPGRSMIVGDYRIDYDEITTSLAEQKELVMFWYQAHEETNTGIVKNKIDMGYNKLMQNGEEHGFIRVSIPLKDADYTTAKQSGINFIKAFYPHLMEFVNNKVTIQPTFDNRQNTEL